MFKVTVENMTGKKEEDLYSLISQKEKERERRRERENDEYKTQIMRKTRTERFQLGCIIQAESHIFTNSNMQHTTA
jgi:hypothetical protein